MAATKLALSALCSVSLLLPGAVAQAQTAPNAGPPAGAVLDEANAKAKAIVDQLTLEEKLEQLVNVAPAIPRLNIPAYNWWTESLHGAIGAVPTTNFPEPIGLAASFDAPLVHQVAGTVSDEVRALHTLGRQTSHLGKIGTGLDTWSPNINIFRDPRWGRGQETYGEDPFLTARMGVAFVTGMQGADPDLPDVISTPKHFAVHSGPESTRHKADVYVSPHDLEDTYLPAFRAALVEAHAGSVMCAYNSIDGQPACANDLLLKDHLRGAWGFDGYVVSDCDAVKDIGDADRHNYAPDEEQGLALALKAGVDNECNTDVLFDLAAPVQRYRDAYARGLISVADVDRALIRLFSARLRNGDLPGLAERSPSQVPVSDIGAPAHTALALKAAEQSLVLLKNDGVLPLKPGLKIAVIGPHGDSTRVLRGNYSSALSTPPVSVIDGLRQAMPDAEIVRAPYEPTLMDGDVVPASALRTPDGQPGLLAKYFNATYVPPGPFQDMDAYGAHFHAITYADTPSVTRVERGVGSHGGDLASVTDNYRVEWTGFLVPPASGDFRIGLAGAGEVDLDGKAVSKVEASAWGERPTFTTLTLTKDHRYALRVVSSAHGLTGDGLLWKQVAATPADDLKGAADADVIVAVVGLSTDLEGEEMKIKVDGFSGGDKTNIELPADQRDLLRRAKALGKPLVVVLMNGSPLDLSWEKDNAAAMIEAWYPGQAGGAAIADALAGKADPGGRLPLTFYKSVSDLPPFDDYAMKGRTYRYFTGAPVYPFGYGLSYTRFAYGPLHVEAAPGGAETGVTVSTDVTNVGGRPGDEVAELYIKPPAFQGAPRLALRGFERLNLAPGQHRTISFTLSPRDLSFVDRDGDRHVLPGDYTISVGSGQPDSGAPGQSAPLTLTRDVLLPR